MLEKNIILMHLIKSTPHHTITFPRIIGITLCLAQKNVQFKNQDEKSKAKVSDGLLLQTE